MKLSYNDISKIVDVWNLHFGYANVNPWNICGINDLWDQLLDGEAEISSIPDMWNDAVFTKNFSIILE